ncbi:MAG: class I SAM-dependent methyltransferase [Clostridia bacterium]|nr:class I SAM-dependent methyltransferase [Clostridia bacterium]
MWISDKWQDYKIIDTSSGEKLERWGSYTLVRPDPQVIWKSERRSPLWQRADAHYKRSKSGGGAWGENRLPESWTVGYRDLTFLIKPMGFKHTGIFPEQAVNWDFCRELIEGAGRPVRVLNLFAYTGGATVACAKAGASVVHVDASRGMVAQAKENARLSGLSEAPIRYIVDDCKKFIEREIRRGNKYDGIIMDPPSYGRGPTGEVWKIEDAIDEFVALTKQVLSDDPIFFLLNSYTTGLSPSTMKYIVDLRLLDTYTGSSVADELGLPVGDGGLALPCGSTVRAVFGKNKDKKRL